MKVSEFIELVKGHEHKDLTVFIWGDRTGEVDILESDIFIKPDTIQIDAEV